MLGADPVFTSAAARLAALTIRDNVPAFSPYPVFALAGGLMSSGGDIAESCRLAGVYVGRVLSGQKPGRASRGAIEQVRIRREPENSEIDRGQPGFQRMEAMARHRSHSLEFKRRVAQEFIAGETLHAIAKRHDVSRTLIRVWVKRLEAGALDDHGAWPAVAAPIRVVTRSA